MLKAERQKLENEFRLEMGRLQAKYAHGGESYEISGEFGRISIHLYMAETHKSFTWVAMRLLDWPDDVHYPDSWGKFAHWKQNFYMTSSTADQCMSHFRNHLKYLGVANVSN